LVRPAISDVVSTVISNDRCDAQQGRSGARVAAGNLLHRFRGMPMASAHGQISRTDIFAPESAHKASQFQISFPGYILQHIVAHLNHCRGRTLTWRCTATSRRKPE
jgi:hypothetical protein